MGADWVRVRVDLARDPKVISIARALSEDRRFRAWASADASADGPPPRPVTVRVTVAGLVAVWGVLRTDGRADGDDLAVDHLCLDDLDEIAGVPGLGAAMAGVGWAVARPGGGVCLPKFFAQNGSTDDLRRARDAERKRRARAAASAQAGADPGETSADASADTSADASAESPPQRERKRISNTQAGRRTAKGQEDTDFTRFWAAYPRHEKKADAAEAFAKLAPGPELLALMLAAIERQKHNGCLEPRFADGRDVRPHPTSWLNGKRWEDEEPGGSRGDQPAVDPRERTRLNLLRMVREETITMEMAEDQFGGPLQ